MLQATENYTERSIIDGKKTSPRENITEIDK